VIAGPVRQRLLASAEYMIAGSACKDDNLDVRNNIQIDYNKFKTEQCQIN